MVAALALVVVFAFGLSWVFTTLGLVMRSPNAVMNAGFMAIFPLTFLSNVFVEPDTLPGALEWFVNVNPISILADASRGLMAGDAQASDILISLGVAAALTAVFLPLTTRLYSAQAGAVEHLLKNAGPAESRRVGKPAGAAPPAARIRGRGGVPGRGDGAAR